MDMYIEEAERLKNLPPYLFDAIDRAKQAKRISGGELIDLSIGDPDRPTFAPIVEALKQASADPQNHQYPPYQGILELRQAIAQWFTQRFGPSLDPEREIVILIGSKEGIAHVPLAFVNPGEIVLIPSPGYPVYYSSTIFAGGRPEVMPLWSSNNFLPDLSDIHCSLLDKAKIIFLNYPNNPTGAIAPLSFFEEVVAFAHKYNIIICHDNAYSEIFFNNQRQPSILEVDGAKEVTIEFHSFSKTYNMTGWRIGFAVGGANILKNLLKVKTHVDSGCFVAIQKAAICALKDCQHEVEKMRQLYQKRMAVLVNGLKASSWEATSSAATFYLWSPLSNNRKSIPYAMELLQKSGVVITPGVGFGEQGEGYVRMALTVEEDKLREALERIKSFDLCGWFE